jgi:hypothetical protein
MAEIYTKRIPYFLDNVLNTPAGALPKGAQWVVAFDDLGGNVLPAINKALAYEKKEWMIDGATGIVTSEAFQETKGCVYCQAIDLPGEGLVVNPEGNIMSNAFLRSYVGQGRNQFPVMRMTFLETNVSFADNFLRPWVIATGTFGLIARARGEEKNYRTNIYCYKLGTYSGQDEAPIVLMKMTFYDACCVSVSNEEYNYAPLAGNPLMREAQFVYNYYSVETDSAEKFHTTSNPTSQVAALKSSTAKVNVVSTFENNFNQKTKAAIATAKTNNKRTSETLDAIVQKAQESKVPAKNQFDKKEEQVSQDLLVQRSKLQERIKQASARPNTGAFQRKTADEASRQQTSQANVSIPKTSDTSGFAKKTGAVLGSIKRA